MRLIRPRVYHPSLISTGSCANHSFWISPQQWWQVVACGKEPACQFRRCKRLGLDPWVRKIPWRRARQPTPVFLLGESHGQRACQATAHRVTKSQTRLKWLSTHIHTQYICWFTVFKVYTPFIVFIKCRLYFLCCIIYPWSLFTCSSLFLLNSSPYLSPSPFLSPLVTTNLFSVSVNLFLFCYIN